jgi:hypothetical protein
MKTSQLQIRVTLEQKEKLKELARAASLDVSTWVLRQILPAEAERFQELTVGLEAAADRAFAWAELADFLRSLPVGAFRRAVAHAPRAHLDADVLNHLAASIELAAQSRGQRPPDWTRKVTIPETPAFGSRLRSVRLHLLTQAPVALRRRNLFMDASIDDRV